MRSAGCAFNDWADRDFDAHVKRTADRPLAAGEIAPWEALAAGRAARARARSRSCSRTNAATILLVVRGAGDRHRLSVLQALLRAAAGVPGHRVLVRHPDGVRGRDGQRAALRLAAARANLFWVIAYDTEYAMVDRDDDVRIGMRTSAITFGRFDVLAVALLLRDLSRGHGLGGRVRSGSGRCTTRPSVVAALIAVYHVWLIRGARSRRAASARSCTTTGWASRCSRASRSTTRCACTRWPRAW